jgi:hypothetical protein
VSSPPASNGMGRDQALTSKPLYGRRMKFKKISCLRSSHEHFGAAEGIGSKSASCLAGVRTWRILHNAPNRDKAVYRRPCLEIRGGTRLSIQKTLPKIGKLFQKVYRQEYENAQKQEQGGATRAFYPLRATPVYGPENGPFPAVRASAACAPNDRACLSLGRAHHSGLPPSPPSFCSVCLWVRFFLRFAPG